MIIYISMLLFLLVCYFFHIASKNRRINHDGKDYVSAFESFIVFGYIVFWAGIRNGFVDTKSYIQGFNNATLAGIADLELNFTSGWGFALLQILFKTYISSNYHVWLMSIAIVSGYLVSRTFRKYSENYYYSVFIFLALTNYTWLMNGIRQFLVVSIMFACIPLIEKKKWLPYFIIVFLCVPIHFTVIMMIPVYFICNSKPWKIQTLIVIVAVVAIAMFTSNFATFLDALFEDSYGEVSGQFAQDDGVNPIRALVYSIPVIIAFLCKRQTEKMDNRLLNIMINMSILTSAIYIVAMFTSGILIGRLPVYTQMCGYIMLPYLLNHCFSESSRKVIYGLSIIGFIGFFFLNTRGTYYSSEITGLVY